MPKLENWSIYNGALVGEVYGHPTFIDGANIIVPFRRLDLAGMKAHTKNRVYALGESAKSEETICANMDCPEDWIEDERN